MDKKAKKYLGATIVGFFLAILSLLTPIGITVFLLPAGVIFFLIFLKKLLDSKYNSKFFISGGHLSDEAIQLFIIDPGEINNTTRDLIVSHQKNCGLCRSRWIIAKIQAEKIERKLERNLKKADARFFKSFLEGEISFQ